MTEVRPYPNPLNHLVQTASQLPFQPLSEDMVRTASEHITQAYSQARQGNIFRRCNLKAEAERTAKATTQQARRQERAMMRHNLRQLSHEFNLAGRLTDYWMKIVVEDKDYHLCYWNTDDETEKNETAEEALQKESAFDLLERGVNNSNYPQRERNFAHALKKIASSTVEKKEQGQEQIYILASPPPEDSTAHKTREGFGTHSFIYIYQCTWINDTECHIHIKQLRTELSRVSQIKMLNTHNPQISIPENTPSEELIGIPVQAQKSKHISIDEFIEEQVYAPMLEAAQDRIYSEKSYREIVRSEEEIRMIHEQVNPLFLLYEELALRNCPDWLKIQILNAIEWQTKQHALAYIQKKVPTLSLEAAERTLSAWVKSGTYDCPLQDDNEGESSEQKTGTKNKLEMKIIVCPDCNRDFLLVPGMSACPYADCEWDYCKPDTTGKKYKQKQQKLSDKAKIKRAVAEQHFIIEPIKTKNESPQRIYTRTHAQPSPKVPQKHQQEQIQYIEETGEYLLYFFGIPIRTKTQPRRIQTTIFHM